MTQTTKIERAENRDDQKVIYSNMIDCYRCGSIGPFIHTYYDELAPDTECVECGYTF